LRASFDHICFDLDASAPHRRSRCRPLSRAAAQARAGSVWPARHVLHFRLPSYRSRRPSFLWGESPLVATLGMEEILRRLGALLDQAQARGGLSRSNPAAHRGGPSLEGLSLLSGVRVVSAP
jgi:hypothetical protein